MHDKAVLSPRISPGSDSREFKFCFCARLATVPLTMNKSVILAILLYILIYLVRWQQGGWEIQTSLFDNLRNQLDQQISHYLDSPYSNLLSGILLGNKKDLPAQLKLALRDTSTLHMVVVSGQNLTILMGFFMGLAGLIRRRLAMILTLIACIFYIILTGAQVPVLRAGLMAILALVAQMFGRERDGVWALLTVAGLFLLINPQWIQDLSFQLSFLATAGVVMVAPLLMRRLQFLPNFLATDLAVTVGAQLLVLPVILQNFHQISYVSVITNLLVGWTMPMMMILGTIMLIFSLIIPVLGAIGATLVNIFLMYFVYVVEFFANLPFAWEYVGEQVWIVWVGYYLLLGGVLLGLNKKS